MAPRPLIIDCDPGQDDAVALLLAYGSPDELDILGVTTVAGNVPLASTQANARRVTELAGRTDVGVYAGCARPFMRPLVTAEWIHGETGLDGAGLADPAMALQEEHGVDFIINTLMVAERPVTLAPTGPLTNIAMAMVKEPRILPNIEEIVLMGGAMDHGNVTPAAEFNIYVDPHAAHVVFTSGVRIIMLGLDVTHKVITTPERLDAIRALDTPVSRSVAGMLDFYNQYDIERYGMAGGPLHDPCVVGYLLQPELFSGRQVHVAIDTSSELSMGRTVVDWWNANDEKPNAMVIDQADADAFYALLTERLARL
jgi:purine nucleosidase